MSQRSLRTAPKSRVGALWGPLGALGPTYKRHMVHFGPQERPNIGLRRSQMPSWGRLGSVLVPFGASWGVLGAVLCPCERINSFWGSRWPKSHPQITPNRPKPQHDQRLERPCAMQNKMMDRNAENRLIVHLSV